MNMLCDAMTQSCEMHRWRIGVEFIESIINLLCELEGVFPFEHGCPFSALYAN